MDFYKKKTFIKIFNNFEKRTISITSEKVIYNFYRNLSEMHKTIGVKV